MLVLVIGLLIDILACILDHENTVKKFWILEMEHQSTVVPFIAFVHSSHLVTKNLKNTIMLIEC